MSTVFKARGSEYSSCKTFLRNTVVNEKVSDAADWRHEQVLILYRFLHNVRKHIRGVSVEYYSPLSEHLKDMISFLRIIMRPGRAIQTYFGQNFLFHLLVERSYIVKTRSTG